MRAGFEEWRVRVFLRDHCTEEDRTVHVDLKRRKAVDMSIADLNKNSCITIFAPKTLYQFWGFVYSVINNM